MVKILKKRYPTSNELTHRWLWISVAKLGGFMARKGDGEPGSMTLWRGLLRLNDYVTALTIFSKTYG